MRLLIQVCKEASVSIDNKVVASIDKGMVVFVGFTTGDNLDIIKKMVTKLLKIRIFTDQEGKTNLNLSDYNGGILAVSQFTLYAHFRKGNLRPSFTESLNKEEANILFFFFKNELSQLKPDAQYGVFHADMKVSLINDGPFTIYLDSKEML